MHAHMKKMAGLFADQTGQVTIEWTLVLVVFGLPMIYIFGMLLSIMAEYYRQTTFLVTLPF